MDGLGRRIEGYVTYKMVPKDSPGRRLENKTVGYTE